MRSIIATANGPVLQGFETPVAGPGFVLVRVRAAALNRADLAMLTGGSHGVAGGIGFPLGLEWAGEIVELGAGVDGWCVGDRVMGASPGALSEYVAANPAWIYRVPAHLAVEQAAALPVSLQTMHDAIVSNGQLSAGQSVLIQGASSAMGLMGLQIASQLGAALVIGSSTSEQRRARLAGFGAHRAIDTGAPDWVRQVHKATRMKGVDLTIDLLAGPLINSTLQATRVGGRLINVGRMAGETGEFDFDQHSMRRISYVGVTFRTRTPAEISEVIARANRDLMPLLENGRLAMPVDRVYRFEQYAEAFTHMAGNRHFGKIVLALQD